MLYFNSEDIIDVVREGYRDDEDRVFVTFVTETVSRGGWRKGDTRRLREVARQSWERGEQAEDG